MSLHEDRIETVLKSVVDEYDGDLPEAESRIEEMLASLIEDTETNIDGSESRIEKLLRGMLDDDLAGDEETLSRIENLILAIGSGEDASGENQSRIEILLKKILDEGIYGSNADPWEAVFRAERNGRYKTKYSLGYTIPLDLGTEGIVNMEIVAFDSDELSDGSGAAKITWMSKELLNTSHQMNPANDNGANVEGTGTIGGWIASDMRNYIKNTIAPLIPESLLSEIKEVKKYSAMYDVSGNFVNDVESVDKLWIPSGREMFGSSLTKSETKGATYSNVFVDGLTRQKKKIGDTDPKSYWVRSAHNNKYFKAVSKTGLDGRTGSETNLAIAIGFCT